MNMSWTCPTNGYLAPSSSPPFITDATAPSERECFVSKTSMKNPSCCPQSRCGSEQHSDPAYHGNFNQLAPIHHFFRNVRYNSTGTIGIRKPPKWTSFHLATSSPHESHPPPPNGLCLKRTSPSGHVIRQFRQAQRRSKLDTKQLVGMTLGQTSRHEDNALGATLVSPNSQPRKPEVSASLNDEAWWDPRLVQCRLS